jgi:hypothetical protein
MHNSKEYDWKRLHSKIKCAHVTIHALRTIPLVKGDEPLFRSRHRFWLEGVIYYTGFGAVRSGTTPKLSSVWKRFTCFCSCQPVDLNAHAIKHSTEFSSELVIYTFLFIRSREHEARAIKLEIIIYSIVAHGGILLTSCFRIEEKSEETLIRASNYDQRTGTCELDVSCYVWIWQKVLTVHKEPEHHTTLQCPSLHRLWSHIYCLIP